MAFGSVLGQKPPELDNSKIKIDANQIVSGVLPLIRGGTGQTTIQGLKNALGIPSSMGISTILDTSFYGQNSSSKEVQGYKNYKVIFGVSQSVELYGYDDSSKNYKFWYEEENDVSRNQTTSNVKYYPIIGTYNDQAGFFFAIQNDDYSIAYSLNTVKSRHTLYFGYKTPEHLIARWPGMSGNGYIKIYGIN